MKGLDGVNIDAKGIKEQVIFTRKLAERLVNPTLLEIEGWKRILFFPKTFDIFGFEGNSISLTYEEVGHPISNSNKNFYSSRGLPNPHSYAKTFIVSNQQSV